MVEPSPIRSYRLDPLVFERTIAPRVKRRVMMRGALVVALACLVLGAQAALDPAAGSGLALAVPIAAAAIACGLFLGRRAALATAKRAWSTYVVTLSPNVIHRQVSTHAPMEIFRSDVVRVEHDAGYGLTVLTADRNRSLFVPEGLVAYDEVVHRLATWAPQAKAKKRRFRL